MVSHLMRARDLFRSASQFALNAAEALPAAFRRCFNAGVGGVGCWRTLRRVAVWP